MILITPPPPPLPCVQAAGHRRGHRHLHHRGHVLCARQLRGVPRGGEVQQGQAPAVCEWLRPGGVLAGQLRVGHGEGAGWLETPLLPSCSHQPSLPS